MRVRHLPAAPVRALAAPVGLLFALLLPCPAAWAQAGAGCVPGGTVAEVNACALQDFQTADTAIAVLYGDVMRALSAHERPQLRQEHGAWQRARTAQCKQATRSTEAQPDGPRIYHGCLVRETQERRRGLMRWLRTDSPAKP